MSGSKNYTPGKSGIIKLASVLLIFLLLPANVFAEPTNVVVYVKAKGSKFIGTQVGGARVTLKDTATGNVLAEGVTSGPSGNTDLIMNTCRKEGEPIADNSAARYSVTLDIDKPTYLEIKAYGPLAFSQAAAGASVTQWLFPGNSLNQGDAVLLELSGLIVDIGEKGKEFHIQSGKKSLDLSVPVRITTL